MTKKQVKVEEEEEEKKEVVVEVKNELDPSIPENKQRWLR